MIVALAGRLIDAPDVGMQQFPLKNAGLVRSRLTKMFKEAGATVLVCSATSGADLIALQVGGGVAGHASKNDFAFRQE